MKKSIMILMLVTTGFFCSGQSSTDSVYARTDSVYMGPSDSVKVVHVVPREPNGPTKAGLAKAIKTGTIYNSTSPYHNILHEFTSLVVTRDYCTETLAQMRTSGNANINLAEKLKTELSKAKAELSSSKYKGLSIETGYYDLFLKQVKDQFRE